MNYRASLRTVGKPRTWLVSRFRIAAEGIGAQVIDPPAPDEAGSAEPDDSTRRTKGPADQRRSLGRGRNLGGRTRGRRIRGLAGRRGGLVGDRGQGGRRVVHRSVGEQWGRAGTSGGPQQGHDDDGKSGWPTAGQQGRAPVN